MASGIIELSTTKEIFLGRIVWNSSSNGTSANTSNVYAELQIKKANGTGTTTGHFSEGISVAGYSISDNVYKSVSTDWVTVISLTKYNVPHNSNGTGSCKISGWCYGPSGTS